jgi:hypothetical protein
MKREGLTGTFELALVLLGVLSATEFQFLMTVFGDQTALRFVTMPYLIMLLLWIFKEMFKEKTFSKEVTLLVTELCWELWCLTFAYYLLFLFILMVPTLSIFSFFESMLIGLLTYCLVLIAHYYAYRNEVLYYYTTNKWKSIRLLFVAIGAFIILIVFYIIPQYSNQHTFANLTLCF